MTDQSAVEARGRELGELLAAYALVRRQADSLPLVVWPPLGSRWPAAHVRIPLLRAFVPVLLTHRLSRAVAALSRSTHERAALSTDPEPAERDLRALEHFGHSLPSVPYRRLTIGFLLAVLLVAYGLSNGAFRSESDAQGIARALDGVLTLDPGAAADAFRSFELRGALGAAFTLALSFLLVAAPAASSFRLERILLNRHPAGGDGIERESVAEHAGRTTGVYVLEQRAFAAVGGPRPRELPLDLIVRAVALVVPIWVALILGVLAAFAGSDGEPWAWPLALAASAIVLLALEALASTRRTATLRRLRAQGKAPPARARRLPSRLRSAAVAAAALGLAVSVALPAVSREPGVLFVEIGSVALDADITRGQYFARVEVPAPGFTPGQLAARGYMFTYRVAAAAPDDEQTISLEHALYDAATHAKVSSNRALVLRPGDIPQSRGRSVDTRELVLLHLSTARRPRDVKPAYSGELTFWAFRPRRPGLYVAELRATGGSGVVLDAVRTAAFPVEAER